MNIMQSVDVHARYSAIRSGKSIGIGDEKHYGYESVVTCLERIVPRLSRLIVNDYDNKSGYQSAINEFFHDQTDEFSSIRKSRGHVVRNQTSP